MATRSRKRKQAIEESVALSQSAAPSTTASGSDVVYSTTSSPNKPKKTRKRTAKPAAPATPRENTPDRFAEAPKRPSDDAVEKPNRDIDPETGEERKRVGVENILSVTRPLLPGEQGPVYNWQKAPKGKTRGVASTHQKVVAVPELSREVAEATKRYLGIEPRKSSAFPVIKNKQHIKDLDNVAKEANDAYRRVTDAADRVSAAADRVRVAGSGVKKAKAALKDMVDNKEKYAGMPAEDVLNEISSRKLAHADALAAHEEAKSSHQDAKDAHAVAIDKHDDAQRKFAYVWANATGQVVPLTRSASKGGRIRQTSGDIDKSMIGPSKSTREKFAAEQAISRVTGRRVKELGEPETKTLVDSAIDESTNETLYGSPSVLTLNELKRAHRPGRGKSGKASDIFGKGAVQKSVEQEAVSASHAQNQVRGRQLKASVEYHLTRASYYAKNVAEGREGTLGMRDAATYKQPSEKDIDYLKELHSAVGDVHGRDLDESNSSPCEAPGCPHYSEGVNNEFCPDHGGVEPIYESSHAEKPTVKKPVPMPKFSSIRSADDIVDQSDDSILDKHAQKLQQIEQNRVAVVSATRPSAPSPSRADVMRQALAQHRTGEQIAANRASFVAQPPTTFAGPVESLGERSGPRSRAGMEQAEQSQAATQAHWLKNAQTGIQEKIQQHTSALAFWKSHPEGAVVQMPHETHEMDYEDEVETRTGQRRAAFVTGQQAPRYEDLSSRGKFTGSLVRTSHRPPTDVNVVRGLQGHSVTELNKMPTAGDPAGAFGELHSVTIGSPAHQALLQHHTTEIENLRATTPSVPAIRPALAARAQAFMGGLAR